MRRIGLQLVRPLVKPCPSSSKTSYSTCGRSRRLLDHLVRLGLDDARILRSLDHQQRRLDLSTYVIGERSVRKAASVSGLPTHRSMNRFHVGGTARRTSRGSTARRCPPRNPVVRQPRHAGRTANPPYEPPKTPIRSRVDPVLLMQPLDRVIPVPHVPAAPVVLDQLLVRLAVPGRAADVRCEDGDAAGEQVLVQGW